MRKYFTRRCMALHALTLVLVPAFLAAGWWQYHVALGGNDLSWVYTFEWPSFAVYALYTWWKLIHDESTPLDRLWAARQRAVAEDSGMPLYQIPGWARDKELSRAVIQASAEAAQLPGLSAARLASLQAQAHGPAGAVGTPPVREEQGPVALPSSSESIGGGGDLEGRAGPVIDAQAVDVRVHVDEEMEAYNRYLFELSWNDPPKRWGSSRKRRRRGVAEPGAGSEPQSRTEQRELPTGDRGTGRDL